MYIKLIIYILLYLQYYITIVTLFNYSFDSTIIYTPQHFLDAEVKFVHNKHLSLISYIIIIFTLGSHIHYLLLM